MSSPPERNTPRTNDVSRISVRSPRDGEVWIPDRRERVEQKIGLICARSSASHDRGHASASRTRHAYGIGHDLRLFSNFTHFLEDPVHGDQIEQADHRFVTGGKVSEGVRARWADKEVKNTFGVQVRNDDIPTVALFHTQARTVLDTRSDASVHESAGGMYAQDEIAWTPWLRSMVGLRSDGVRFNVIDHVQLFGHDNGGGTSAQIVSPKASVIFGPSRKTEAYVNAGEGFHSNHARGTTATLDAQGNRIATVTPLVKAKGAEVGVRTVAIPHLQSTLTVWMLHLASELVYDADQGTTDPSRPSEARGGVCELLQSDEVAGVRCRRVRAACSLYHVRSDRAVRL